MEEPDAKKMDKKEGDQILNDLYTSLRTRDGASSSSSSSSSSRRKQKKSSKSKDEWSKGALFQAAKKSNAEGFTDVLKQVLTEYKELSLEEVFDSVNESDDTLLHVAVNHGNEDTLRLIGSEFPHLLTKKNSKGDTVWHVAAKTKYVEVFKELFSLQTGFINHLTYSKNRSSVTWDDISLREINKEGNTALHVALICRHIRMADQLVKQDWNLSYYVNYENKSALYLAAESGYLDTLKLMLKDGRSSEGNIHESLKGKSLVHAAIMGRHTDVLDFLLKEELVFRNEDGWAPLHWAASIGFLEGVVYLLTKYSVSATERDENGLFPIHWASRNGHVYVVQELIQYCKAPSNLLTLDKQNVLHVAAKNGKLNVVSYILKTPELENFINERDGRGNTPLHYATMNWHPRIVSALTWDNRVDINSRNEDGFTPLDAAKSTMKGINSFQQWLTWQALKAAGAKRASSIQPEPATIDFYNGLSVAMLVGGICVVLSRTLHGVDTDQATKISILRNIKFHLFNFCVRIALSSSTVAAANLIWAQLGNINNRVFNAFTLKPLLGMALAMMSLAFLSGMILVARKLYWLADTILTTGMVFLVSFMTLFIPLCCPLPTSFLHILRYITCYPIRLMLWLSHVS